MLVHDPWAFLVYSAVSTYESAFCDSFFNYTFQLVIKNKIQSLNQLSC